MSRVSEPGTPHPPADASKPPAIFIMGPTASGKTGLAVELVKRLPCEIISVDSVMIYRGMDIGSAKPDAQTLAEAPHRLIDICDPAETFSAAGFRQRALEEIRTIQARGNIPLLVGGTLLYFRALEQGLSPLPSADPEVRADIEARARQHGWAAMHAELAQIDPVAAARIHANDPQRIQRALEVHAISGQSMTSLFAQETATADSPCRWLKLALIPPDRELHRRLIAERFGVMLEQGLVAEVEGLFQRNDLHLDLPAMRAVGYRQVWNYLDGKWDYETMVERGIIATRQYAKRQMTWLRREADTTHYSSTDTKVLTEVLKYLAVNAIC